MTDLRPTIIPKSDQLNADDLIGQTRTITVTKVSLCGEADQPIAVHFEGDNGKPYKPCKSMRRVMVQLWGPDGNAFVGRSMTLYRDEKVQFGGQAVGGIRISHMSHIDREHTLALTATRANRKPFTVRPLRDGGPRQETPAGTQRGSDTPTIAERADRLEATLKGAATQALREKAWNLSASLRTALDKSDPDRLAEIESLFNGLSDDKPAAVAPANEEIPF